MNLNFGFLILPLLVFLPLVVPPSALAQDTTPPAIHEVQPGESLWSIAGLRLSNPRLWPLLYRANRDQIMDPARLYPGQRLSIPKVTEEERRSSLNADPARLPAPVAPAPTPTPAPSEPKPAENPSE